LRSFFNFNIFSYDTSSFLRFCNIPQNIQFISTCQQGQKDINRNTHTAHNVRKLVISHHQCGLPKIFHLMAKNFSAGTAGDQPAKSMKYGDYHFWWWRDLLNEWSHSKPNLVGAETGHHLWWVHHLNISPSHQSPRANSAFHPFEVDKWVVSWYQISLLVHRLQQLFKRAQSLGRLAWAWVSGCPALVKHQFGCPAWQPRPRRLAVLRDRCVCVMHLCSYS